MTNLGTVNGIKDAAALYRYIAQGGSAGGGSFAEALKLAEDSVKSDEEILAETLEEIFLRNRSKDSEEKQEEKKDFWELRTERQKLLESAEQQIRLAVPDLAERCHISMQLEEEYDTPDHRNGGYTFLMT